MSVCLCKLSSCLVTQGDDGKTIDIMSIANSHTAASGQPRYEIEGNFESKFTYLFEPLIPNVIVKMWKIFENFQLSWEKENFFWKVFKLPITSFVVSGSGKDATTFGIMTLTRMPVCWLSCHLWPVLQMCYASVSSITYDCNLQCKLI